MPDQRCERSPSPEPFINLPYAPEPDVTWGLGGIDDWGWTAWQEPQETPPTPVNWQAAA